MDYFVPPKLQQKFLMAGLTISELLIAVALFLFGLATGGFLHSLAYPGLFCLFCFRLLDGRKNLKDLLVTVYRYYRNPQYYTVHLPKKRGKKS